MPFFLYVTPITYWLLFIMWSFIFLFYIDRLKSKKIRSRLLFTLLTILSIDAFRTLFESAYFGAWYTSLAGFLPKTVHAYLVRPEIVFIPKVLNLVAAVVVIVLLLYRWIPQEEREKEEIKNLVDRQTRALRQNNEQLNSEINERKRVEEALRASEGKYRGLFLSIRDAILVADTTRSIIDCNPAFTELFGYSKNDIMGQKTQVVYENEAQFEEMGNALKTHYGSTPFLKTASYKKKNGDIFPGETGVFYLNDMAGNVTGFIGLIRDISDRLRAEQSLQESEKTFQIAMEATHDGLFDWNLVTNEIYYSPGWKRMLGYQDNELPNDFSIWETLTRSEDVKRSWKMQNEMIHQKRDRFEMEFKMKHKDGHWVDILSRAKAIFDTNGTAIRIVGTHVDISERKKAETALSEEKELLRAVFEQAGGYCMLLEPTDSGIPNILDANEAACKIHGYSRQEMIGRPVSDLDDEEGKRLCRERTQIILSGKTLNVVNNHVRKDGTLFPVEVFANIIRFKSRPPLIVTTEFDISDRQKVETDKRELEKQLIQAQKMESIGKLAGGIAHDFNNVLYPIIGFTEMSMDDLPESHPVQENLKDILNGAKRARDLVKQILLFSRQKPQLMKPTRLKPVVEEALKLIRSSIPKNIEIQQDLYSDDDVVLCDATQIHEIVINLCTNAHHAVEERGGRIKITLDKIRPDPELNLPEGPYVCLSVQDDGVGIPSDVINNIFEPYYTTREIGKGSGLGLSVVHGIVKNYKGDISVKSTPGSGSVFKVFLPITRKPDGSEQETETWNASGGTEKILFVDDEDAIVKLGVKALERIGYSVTGIQDSLEALARVKSNPDEFDLVITDMSMPKMVGTQLAEKIVEIRPDMPIILCSGYSEKLDREKSKLLNVKASIDKPILIRNLTETVRKILDHGTRDSRKDPVQ